MGQSSSHVLKNITAHSVDGSGASVLPDLALFEDQKRCYQFSHIQAYKNVEAGIGTMYSTDELRASNLVLVDNTLGISLSTCLWSGANASSPKLIKLSDSSIFGESTSVHDDCPDGPSSATGSTCYCPNKFGFMTFYSETQRCKDPHITELAKRPVYKTIDFANWDG